MGQAAKASIKRKPSYFMSILGVTLVLFLLGIIGWLMLNAKKLGNYFKENVEVRVYLRGDLNPKDSTALMQYISSQPYVKSIEYVNKEEGKKRYMAEGNEDWGRVLEANPLPNAIYFKVNKDYLNVDTLKNIKANLEQGQLSFVSDVQYPEALIGNMNKNIRRIEVILLVIAIVLALVVIVLIDNTIRLAMFSNRFLIKTMQMVGATRWFIAKPMDVRAVINGAISGLIAITAIGSIVFLSERFLPEMQAIHDRSTLVLLFIILIVLGMGITLFSTHRSVVKYLRMKLDDLY
jgi:cell division transport system permease protein